jgi:hypothetical protein
MNTPSSASKKRLRAVDGQEATATTVSTGASLPAIGSIDTGGCVATALATLYPASNKRLRVVDDQEATATNVNTVSTGARHPATDSTGGGGVALPLLWPHCPFSADTKACVSAKLDAHIYSRHHEFNGQRAKRRQPAYDRARVGVEGQQWHPEVIKSALKPDGGSYVFKKVDLTSPWPSADTRGAYIVDVRLPRVIFTGYASSMARRKVSPSPRRSSRSPLLQRQYLHLHGRGRWQRMQVATSWKMRSRAVTSAMWSVCFVGEPETCYCYTSSELHDTAPRMLSEYLRSHPDVSIQGHRRVGRGHTPSTLSSTHGDLRRPCHSPVP